MKTKKIPTVFVLDLYSWAIAVLGALAGAYWIFIKASGHESILSGLFIVFGSFLCAVIIRVFGGLAQMMFDQGQTMQEIHRKFSWLEEIKQKLGSLEEIKQKLVALDRLEEIKLKMVPPDQFEKLCQSSEQTHQKLLALDRLEEIKQKLVALDRLEEIKLKMVPPDQFEKLCQSSEQISCDSKDISQGIHQIKEFFERIQNHLDLNK
jgi:hypothetical protein